MKTLFTAIILFVLSAPAWGAAITSAQSGNWSATSTWAGGAKPVAGDTAVIATGHTVTVDENTIVGSNAAAVGHAITIQATNAATYGKLIVAAGITLTLRGYDTANNTMMLINRYAMLQPQAGAIILGDLASDGQSLIQNNGHISAIGTANSRITFSVPSANVKWDNSVTVTYTGAHGTITALGAYVTGWLPSGQVNSINGIGLSNLTGGQENRIISNAAGNGLGSGLDTSAVINSVTNPTGAITTIKSSLAELANHGDYFIDHRLGILFHKIIGSGMTSGDLNITYKYLSFYGWGIVSNNNAADSSAVFDYCDFSYMGANQYDKEFTGNTSLGLRYKRSAAVDATRETRVEHSTFTHCYHPVQIYDSFGSAAEKIKLRYNTFNACLTHYAANNFNRAMIGIGAFANDTGHIDFSYNDWHVGSVMVMNDRISGTYPLHDLTMSYNTGNAMTQGYLPDGADNLVSYNTLLSLGGAGFMDSRGLSGEGTTGHPFVYEYNTVKYNNRAAVVSSNVIIRNNVISQCAHHGIVVGRLSGYITNILIENNILYDTDNNDMPGGITVGYNMHTWSDSLVVRNNTFNSGRRSILLGDEGESGVVYGTNVQIYNNIVSNIGYGVRRDPATTTTMQNKFNIGRLAKNLEYNFTTPSTFRQCIPKIGADEYNLPATVKNIAGVSIWNPSYTSFPVAAKNLQLISSGTIGADYAATLSWGGGTAVSLLNASGLAQGTVATAANTGVALGSKITVTAAGWPTTGKQLRGKLVLLTNGTTTIPAYIQNNTATELTLVTNLNRAGAFALSGTPDIVTNPTTYKFIIMEAEVSLSDGTNTITAGIDIARFNTATGTFTDSITIEDGLLTGDPKYTSTTDFTPLTGSAAIVAGFGMNYLGAIAPAVSSSRTSIWQKIFRSRIFH